jgi:hypothetical protein
MPTVELSPEWGIEASEGLKATLAAHLDATDEVVLAAPDAGRVHSAPIQLLTAFVRTRAQAGRATRIVPCAPALRDAAVSLGLASELGLA